MPTNDTSSPFQGWTQSPNGRGTLDIVWPCVVTITLSTWSALCLNVPEPGDTTWVQFKRKAWITFISVMGPEYLVGFALSEWQSARASVASLKQLRNDEKWTLKHAFFADMGGFALRTSDGISFFLDAKQIFWLFERKIISPAQFENNFLLDSKVIDDRNKSDIFVRVLAVGQALWFCVNIIARGAQGLSVTTLEITTIGIIVDSLLVYYFWKEKPAGVTSVDIINISMTLDEITLLEEDEAARTCPYFRTPLDFASRDISAFNLIYHYLMNILKNIRPKIWQRDKELFGRRSDNDVRPLTGLAMAIAAMAAAVFMGTNFIAWNFQFPTPIERLLWRVSSCGMIVVLVVGLLIEEFLFSQSRVKTMQESVQKCRKKLEDSRLSGEKIKSKDRLVYKLRQLAMKIRNNCPEQNPDRDVSVVFAVGGVLGFAVYTLFRAYILMEDIVAFRALPTDAYNTVNWWAFIPHIG